MLCAVCFAWCEGSDIICHFTFWPPSGLTGATLTTNIAANIVAPANAFINMAPKQISFRAGAILTAVLGFAIQPWKLLSSTSSFVSTWLVGYSVILGPVIGIILSGLQSLQSSWFPFIIKFIIPPLYMRFRRIQYLAPKWLLYFIYFGSGFVAACVACDHNFVAAQVRWELSRN